MQLEKRENVRPHQCIFIIGDVATGKSTAVQAVGDFLLKFDKNISKVRIDDVHRILYPKGGSEDGKTYEYDENGMLTLLQRELQIPHSLSYVIASIIQECRENVVIVEMTTDELLYCLYKKTDEISLAISNALIMHVNTPVAIRSKRNNLRKNSDKVPESVAAKDNYPIHDEDLRFLNQLGAALYELENDASIEVYRLQIYKLLEEQAHFTEAI